MCTIERKSPAAAGKQETEAVQVARIGIQKFVTPEEAARAVQPGDWVDYGFGGGFPELIDRALADRVGQIEDVKVRGGLVIRPRIEVVERDPEQISFRYHSWHIGDYERKLQARGLVSFTPMILRLSLIHI